MVTCHDIVFLAQTLRQLMKNTKKVPLKETDETCTNNTKHHSEGWKENSRSFSYMWNKKANTTRFFLFNTRNLQRVGYVV